MRQIAAFLRVIKAGWVLAREGVLLNLPLHNIVPLPKSALFLLRFLAKKQSKSQSRAQNIARAIHLLGPSYIKLGQFLATRPDLIGQELANDLSILQDNVEQFPYGEAVLIVERTLGLKIEDVFVCFEPAVAAASMAQVHRAIVKDKEGCEKKVAVKIIRPDVRKRFAKDLESFYLCARLQERFIPSLRRLRPVSVVDNLAQTTKLELDLRMEAAALSESFENTAHDKGFRVPEVDWSRTGRDVLTMEWIDGIKISDHKALRAQGHDLQRLARNLMQAFLRHSLRDGFFHADMHAGNLFVDNKGDIIALDYGITGRLGRKEQYFLAEILYGFITRDYQRVAKVHFHAGYVPDHYNVASFAQANRAIGEPIHGHAANTISMAKLLGLLFEVTELFNMQTRPELLLLQKTMVVVEGTARHLDPQFNMWQTAQPVVKEWMALNMGVLGLRKDLKELNDALFYSLRQSPDLIRKWLAEQEKTAQTPCCPNCPNGRQQDYTAKQAKGAASGLNKANTIALWLIAASLIYIAKQYFA